MDILGLIFEFLILGIGIYCYLFVTGRIRFKDPESAKKAEAFRQSNKLWLRLLSLALIAIMSLEIILHIRQLF